METIGGLGALPLMLVPSQLGQRAEECRKPPRAPLARQQVYTDPGKALKARVQACRGHVGRWGVWESQGSPLRVGLSAVARFRVPRHCGGPTCSSPLPPSPMGSTQQGTPPKKQNLPRVEGPRMGQKKWCQDTCTLPGWRQVPVRGRGIAILLARSDLTQGISRHQAPLPATADTEEVTCISDSAHTNADLNETTRQH